MFIVICRFTRNGHLIGAHLILQSPIGFGASEETAVANEAATASSSTPNTRNLVQCDETGIYLHLGICTTAATSYGKNRSLLAKTKRHALAAFLCPPFIGSFHRGCITKSPRFVHLSLDFKVLRVPLLCPSYFFSYFKLAGSVLLFSYSLITDPFLICWYSLRVLFYPFSNSLHPRCLPTENKMY